MHAGNEGDRCNHCAARCSHGCRHGVIVGRVDRRWTPMLMGVCTNQHFDAGSEGDALVLAHMSVDMERLRGTVDGL